MARKKKRPAATVVCPYCDTVLPLSQEAAAQRRVTVSCSFCYGIFTWEPKRARLFYKARRNLYEVLGVSVTADPETVRKRHAELRERFADREPVPFNTGARQDPAIIDEAGRILSDIPSRVEYDVHRFSHETSREVLFGAPDAPEEDPGRGRTLRRILLGLAAAAVALAVYGTLRLPGVLRGGPAADEAAVQRAGRSMPDAAGVRQGLEAVGRKTVSVLEKGAATVSGDEPPPSRK